MHLRDYQKKSRKVAIYPNVGNNVTYPLIGITGELGEVAEKIKKVIRDKEGIIDEIVREEIKKEMGDVLWYFSQLASELDLSLVDIAQDNIEKIESRMQRGQVHGEGDNR